MALKERLVRALQKPASRWQRFLREIFVDVFLITVSLWFSYVLTDGRLGAHIEQSILLESGILGLVAVGLLAWRGLYSINVRYIGLGDFLNIGLVGLLLCGIVVLERLNLSPDTRASFLLLPLLFGFIAITLLTGVRVAKRLYSWRTVPGVGSRAEGSKARKTLIVGAGDAGEMVMREISRSPHPLHNVVGFVDDDEEKRASRIHGIKVLGPTALIPSLVKDLSIEELVLAIPSAKGQDMRRLTNLCYETKARLRTLPPVKTLLTGGPHIFSHLREVDIEDLLRRETVQTDLAKISEYIGGERVMITGGGGSIGSELARQISNLTPASLLLLGKGENSVYEIEQELVHTNRYQPTCVISDVRDRQSMERAFRMGEPSVVFHAAAHKHVPLMQGNPIEAIRNNVFGTWLTCELAIKYGVGQFIYVSTDKAVKPTSIMGATKRVGEMIVTALGQRSETNVGIVRFGNVMGSRGSLIPLLKAQIKRGGPVRVTHPDMTRYFMTIPEAVQLILQAGALGKRGEIFLLDMGEPIKILDIAMDLIRLHGLVPGEDIDIQFTGVRPGEKIHEELLYEQEELSGTAHPKISAVRNNKPIEWEWLRAEVEHLLDLCDEGRAEDARHCLMELAWGKSASQNFPVVGHAIL